MGATIGGDRAGVKPVSLRLRQACRQPKRVGGVGRRDGQD